MSETPSFDPDSPDHGEQSREEERAQEEIVKSAQKKGLDAAKTERGYFIASKKKESNLERPDTKNKPHIRAVEDGEKVMSKDEYNFRKLLAKKTAVPEHFTAEDEAVLSELAKKYGGEFGYESDRSEVEVKESKESDLRIEAGVYSVKSTKHENQDNYLIDKKRGVACVADGLGSEGKEVGGIEASFITTRLIGKVFEKRRGIINSDARATEVMQDAIKTANSAITELQSQQGHKKALEVIRGLGILNQKEMSDLEQLGPEFLKDMKTTASAMAFYKNEQGELSVVIGHIGDSRIYELSNKGLEQITADHDPITDALENGWIDENDANNLDKGIVECPKLHSELNNSSTRAFFERKFGKSLEEVTLIELNNIGVSKSIGMMGSGPDVSTRRVESGRQYLLCSDGLNKNLSDEKIEEEMNGDGSLQEKAKRITLLAKGEAKTKKGTYYDDDITVLTIEAPIEEIDTDEVAA